ARLDVLHRRPGRGVAGELAGHRVRGVRHGGHRAGVGLRRRARRTGTPHRNGRAARGPRGVSRRRLSVLAPDEGSRGMPKPDAGQRWVLLTYRMPREPSTPRIALWRKLEQLGVARLGDGLVAIPADPRTREQLDWIAEDIRHAGGTASVWLATPADPVQEQALVDTTRAA